MKELKIINRDNREWVEFSVFNSLVKTYIPTEQLDFLYNVLKESDMFDHNNKLVDINLLYNIMGSVFVQKLINRQQIKKGVSVCH